MLYLCQRRIAIKIICTGRIYQIAHGPIGIAGIVQQRRRRRGRYFLTADEPFDPPRGRPRILLDLHPFLIQPKRTAIFGSHVRHLVDLDDDTGNLGAQSVLEFGHFALRLHRVAQDILAQVFDRLDGLHQITGHIA